MMTMPTTLFSSTFSLTLTPDGAYESLGEVTDGDGRIARVGARFDADLSRGEAEALIGAGCICRPPLPIMSADDGAFVTTVAACLPLRGILGEVFLSGARVAVAHDADPDRLIARGLIRRVEQEAK
jgi:hypothetical protein